MTRSTSALKALGRIRVGVLGDDESALDDHLEVLRRLSDYELIGVHNGTPALGKDKPGNRIRPTFRSAKELISHPDVDLVSAVGASAQTEGHVRDAIAAGKDVYCDWSVLSNPRKARELAALAERSGISHVIGLFPRVSQATLCVGDLLAEGYIGNVTSVRLYANLTGAEDNLSIACPHSVLTISPITELALHFLDALFSMVGWPRRVSFVVGSRTALRDSASTEAQFGQLCAIGLLESDGVFSAHFDGWLGPPAVQIDIAGDKGKLKIEAPTDYYGDNVAIEASRGRDEPPHLVAIPRSYKWISSEQFPAGAVGLANLYALFARDLHEGTERTPTMDDAVRMHELLRRITKSWNLFGRSQP